MDLLLLGDGYTAAEMGKWHADAKRLALLLFSTSPFKERQADFNVWAVDTPSEESGVSRPSDGVHRRSALRAAYDAFGSERYVLAFDNKRVREAAAAAPYDVMEIVVNGRTYGGGGIFNLYATVASDNAFTPYVFVHEFGHHFAGLADEYYTSDVAYGSTTERPEPWERNVTASAGSPKWKDLVTSGDAAPDALGQGGLRGGAEGDPGPPPEDPGGETAGGGDGGPLPRGAGEGGRASRRRADASAVGTFEGAMYEAKGLLPGAGQLHHVHAPRGVLPRLPAGASRGSSTCTRARHRRPVRRYHGAHVSGQPKDERPDLFVQSLPGSFSDLGPLGRELSLDAGAVLWKEGDPGDHVVFLRSRAGSRCRTRRPTATRSRSATSTRARWRGRWRRSTARPARRRCAPTAPRASC